jgi:drug/metabolite transporter (DMT)-like permease
MSARVITLTAFTLVFFAANSLLARAALGGGLADAAGFTAVRLGAGALALAAMVAVVRRRRPSGGSWGAAATLLAYAVAFSLAYVRLAAGPGALILFCAVQATMIGWSVLGGARPAPRQWLGLGIALLGLAGLTLPGAAAPDPAGAALMLAAGIGWGGYSLLGRGPGDPISTNAANFARSVALGLPFALAALALGSLRLSPGGAALAAVSGALTSGMGYVLWYAVIPELGATRAAVVQLAVPVLTPLAAASLLDERLTPRLAVAGATILAGVALAVVVPRSRPGVAPPEPPNEPSARL